MAKPRRRERLLSVETASNSESLAPPCGTPLHSLTSAADAEEKVIPHSSSAQQRLALLLRRVRDGTASDVELVEMRECWLARAWKPLQQRPGSFFGRIVGPFGRCCGTSSRSLASAGGPAGKSERRWKPELCGGSLERADLGTEAGRAKALAALKRREPIILSGAWKLLPAARSWKIENLVEHLSGASRPCNVLKARRDTQKYTYYFKNCPDREMPAKAGETVPVNEDLTMGIHCNGQGAQ